MHAWALGPQVYSSSEAVFQLPPGDYTVAAFKGMEYLDTQLEFHVEANQAQTITLQLRRWIHMKQESWYSADDHLHIPRFEPQLDPMILACMKAETEEESAL